MEVNIQEEYNVLTLLNFVQLPQIFVPMLVRVKDFAIKVVVFVKILQLRCTIAIWLFKIYFLIFINIKNKRHLFNMNNTKLLIQLNQQLFLQLLL